MKTVNLVVAALLVSAAVGAAVAATPDWGSAPSVASTTNNEKTNGQVVSLKPPTRAQLSCAFSQTPTTMTFLITNVSMAQTPKGTSQITLCNMRQPNGPTPPSNCGSLGSYQLPAIKAGGTYALTEPAPYVSATPPSCQAATVVPTSP